MARRTGRWGPILLIVLGLGLVAAPFLFQMFARAPQGAEMLDEFEPFMTDERITRFQGYMVEIDAAVVESDTAVRPYLAENGGIDEQQFDDEFATYTSFEEEWPPIDEDMSDLLARVHRNLDNYDAIAALPSFTLFPWFFVVPGALIAAFGVIALRRPQRRPFARVALVVLGLGLVAAPLVFQMFTRAPEGAEMMDDFETLMTRPRVQTVQGYFSTMAVGQGAIRLELIPALTAAGLDEGQLQDQFPAVVALEQDWVGIINDMTPMIGAMSDNVDNYDALQALPSFDLFPWFFVLPGLITAAVALLALRSPRQPTEQETPPMVRSSALVRTALLATVLALVAFGAACGDDDSDESGSSNGADSTEAAASGELVGTFTIAPGECDDAGTVTGSYFGMVLPGRTVEDGPFFENPDSSCSDKQVTLAIPGTDGGLVTGDYQPQPDPPFDADGSALADAILRPQSFTAINFSVSTNEVDPQTEEEVPPPSITVDEDGVLSGDLRAFVASWNQQYFN